MDWLKQVDGTNVLNMVKSVSNKVKQYALNLSEIEIKVEEATNNEPWGPHGTVMQEITRAAYRHEDYKQIMGVIARRLQDQEEEWRHVYKSLLLLEYMAKHGPQKVVEELVSNVAVIEKLQNFQYKDKNSKDWGLNVRERAKQLITLVTDPDRIRAERKKAKENEAKYKGVSSDDMRMGGSGSSKASGSSFGSSGLGSGGLGSASRGFGSSSRYDDFDGDEDFEDKHHIPASRIPKDPVAATRERIENLKKEGRGLDDTSAAEGRIPAARPSSANKGTKPGEPSQAEPARGKKLSDVKVDPSIAAAFGSTTFVPAVSRAPPPAAAPPSALDFFGADSTEALSHPAPTAGAAADLLSGLGLSDPAPAAPSPANGGWNAFESANTGTSAAAADDDEWSAFASERTNATAPAAKLPAAPADPFAELAAGGTTGRPAGADMFGFGTPGPVMGGSTRPASGVKAALPEDMFSMGVSQPTFGTPMPAPGQGAPMPGFGGAPVPSYTAPRPVSVAPAPAPASMSLSGGVPITPKQKDPFADLSVL